jgi:hypothetical protein
MYYGNPSASNQQNPAGVWDGNYVAVYHLKEDPAGAAPQMTDSTTYGNHGTTEGTWASSASVTAKVAKGFAFNGATSQRQVKVPNAASLDSTAAEGTVELWINWTNAAPGNFQVVMVSSNRFTPGARFGYEWASQGGGGHYFYPWGDDADLDYNLGSNPFTNGAWHHLVVTFKFSTKAVTIYVDGTPMTFTTQNVPTYWTTLANPADWRWGGNNPQDLNAFFAGVFDEIRVSNVARSAAYITTSHKNQNSPATFYSSVGAQEVLGGGGTVIGGDQSGRVYSVDATAGVKYLGDTALTGAERVQAGVSAQVRAWSSAAFQAAYTDNVIFAATLNTSSPTNNKVFALKASDGTLAWPTLFNLNGTDYSVDTIAGQPYVDYVNDRLYVASKAGSSGTQQSLWVIKTVDGEAVLKGQPVSPCTACTVTGRHFDTSPTLSWDGATLYLGAMDGTLYAINTTGLTPKWNLPLGAGANIKTAAFVWEDYSIPGRLYFTTADGNVRCVQDNGGSGSACAGWTVTNVPGASTPLLLGKLFVGSSNGTVYQIDPATGLTDKQFPAAGTLDGTSKLGAISTETGGEIFVGTDGGKIFKITLTSGALP